MNVHFRAHTAYVLFENGIELSIELSNPNVNTHRALRGPHGELLPLPSYVMANGGQVTFEYEVEDDDADWELFTDWPDGELEMESDHFTISFPVQTTEVHALTGQRLRLTDDEVRPLGWNWDPRDKESFACIVQTTQIGAMVVAHWLSPAWHVIPSPWSRELSFGDRWVI